MKWNIWSQLEMASQTKYSLRSKESFIPTVACVTWPDLSPGLFVPGVVISDSKPVVTWIDLVLWNHALPGWMGVVSFVGWPLVPSPIWQEVCVSFIQGVG